MVSVNSKKELYYLKNSNTNFIDNENILNCKNGINCHYDKLENELFISNFFEKRIVKRNSNLKEKRNKIKVVPSTLKFTPEKCNSLELQSIMVDNIVSDEPNESKKRIHKVTNEMLSTKDNLNSHYDVICSSVPFSFRIATQVFCEITVKKVTCFVYQQLGSEKAKV